MRHQLRALRRGDISQPTVEERQIPGAGPVPAAELCSAIRVDQARSSVSPTSAGGDRGPPPGAPDQRRRRLQRLTELVLHVEQLALEQPSVGQPIDTRRLGSRFTWTALYQPVTAQSEPGPKRRSCRSCCAERLLNPCASRVSGCAIRMPSASGRSRPDLRSRWLGRNLGAGPPRLPTFAPALTGAAAELIAPVQQR